MFRRTRSDVPAHIQDAHEKGTVVIAYNITGNIKNCQDVSFQKMPKRPMTGLLKPS